MHRNPASRWFIRLLGTAILFGLGLVALLIAGAAMDADYETAWTCDVPASPTEVLAAFESADAADRWWTSVEGVLAGATDDGEPAWIVRTGGDATRLQVTVAGTTVRLTVAEDQADVLYVRTLTIEAADEGSRLHLTETGTLEAKLTRAVDKTFRGVGHRAERFLTDLSTHLGGGAARPTD